MEEFVKTVGSLIGVIFVIGLLFLMTKKLFWVLAFWLGGASSFIAMLAFIVHFQILMAIGLFLLGSFLFVIASTLAED